MVRRAKEAERAVGERGDESEGKRVEFVRFSPTMMI